MNFTPHPCELCFAIIAATRCGQLLGGPWVLTAQVKGLGFRVLKFGLELYLQKVG